MHLALIWLLANRHSYKARNMRMYTHARTRQQRLGDEDAFRSAFLVHAEHITSQIVELVAHLVVIIFCSVCLVWVSSVYTRALFMFTTAMLRANARAELQTPRQLFLVA